MDEELAVALGSQDRRGDERAGAQAEPAGRGDDPLEDGSMGGRVADDAAVGAAAPHLELGLDERDDRGAAVRAERRRDRTQDEPERDERDVDHREIDRLAERRRVEMAGVQAIMDDHPPVAGERSGELATPHVDGVDPGRAALEEDVGEATGRGPRVERDEARRVDPERVERGGELVAAATDVRLARDELDRRVRIDEIARLPVEPGRIAGAGPDAAGEDQRLGPGPAVGEAALDDELVETLSGSGAASRRGAHPAIVAQRPSPRLTTGSGAGAVDRPGSLQWAVAIHLLIGVSGIVAGLPLVAGVLSGTLDQFQPTRRDVLVAWAIAFGVFGYGALEVVGAVGVWRRSRRGWWVALCVDLVGLAILGWAFWIAGGSDGILIGGVVLWLIAIATLVAPSTRAGLRR